MLTNNRLSLRFAVALSMMLALVGCGGVGSAPINGTGSLARVAVSIAPPTMGVKTGTVETFTASVSNTSETGVGWLVNGFPGGINPNDGSSPYGTIDKNGNYTAPPFIPAPPIVTVTAVADADNNATANASVSISGTPSPVSIAPLAATLEVGRTVGGIPQLGGIALFTATVNNPNHAVNWLVDSVPGGNANVGTISLVPGSLDQANYIAPQSVPSGGSQIHITAQSVANPQETASAVVKLLPVGSTVVAITSPTLPPTLQVGQSQNFQAKVSGASNTTVSWEVDGIAGGNSNVGTITPGPNETALYIAPARVPNPSQIIVTAVSNAQPAAQASMLVNVIPSQPVTVVVSAENCVNTNAVPVTSNVQFDALVTGTSSQSVTWQVNKITGGNNTVGTITPTGFYTAPTAIPTPATVVVSAVSVDDPLAVGNEPVTIALTTATAVQVSPNRASVQVNLSQDFSSTVLGLQDRAVTWYVNGIEGGDLNTIGQITGGQPTGCVSTAQYVAPPAIPVPPTVSVTAVAFDGTISPPAMVTIVAASQYALHISPKGKVDVIVGQTQPYSATEDGDPNDIVTWSVAGQGCSGVACGTITPTVSQPPQPYQATYTAPQYVPNPPTVTVTVSSQHHPGVNDTDTVVIQSTANPSISITPTFQSVLAGQNQVPFQATIQNYDPAAPVQWQLGCISDWNGEPGEDCNDGERGGDGDGPGCIKVQGGRLHCGNSQALDVPGNLPLTYISPQLLFTNDFKANQCSGHSNDGTGYVELTVTMNAKGCPLGVCTANACVQVKP